MDKKLYELMNWPDIEGIVYSECVHPKALLGQHVTPNGLLIQAFNPFADKAYVVRTTGEKIEMELADEEGFFAVLISGKKKIEYVLEFINKDGTSTETVDIYNYPSLLKEREMKAFDAGNNLDAYKLLGAHPAKMGETEGVLFTVWAPNAMRVSVVGDFCNWDGRIYQMELNDKYGIFELFIPGIVPGTKYQYEIRFKGGVAGLKSDPYGLESALRPDTYSVVYDMDAYEWKDMEWIQEREKYNSDVRPVSISFIYPGNFEKSQNYDSLAVNIIEYAKKMHYTHVELTPMMEYLEDSSIGYHTTGYFAPTKRYGTPDDFKHFIDKLHQAGIGVIMDWTPAQFTKDPTGLACFDGTCVYEHVDKRQGEHTNWGTLIYNYGRPQIADFLLTNALFWIKEYHIDGLKCDAVASMLYLDYGKNAGEWVANIYGGNENLEAIAFLKRLNKEIHKRYKGVITIAEESACWRNVTGNSRDEYALGFDYEWNYGFTNDLIQFMKLDPLFRKGQYNELISNMLFTYNEKFILKISHEDVLNESMSDKMPGEELKNRLASLKAAYGYMMFHPGKKLFCAGQDLGLSGAWSFDKMIDTSVTEENAGFTHYMSDLLALYCSEPCLFAEDNQVSGFEWINNLAIDECVISFVRKNADGQMLLVAVNFTPVMRKGYKIGVPKEGKYKEIFNSDAAIYGGNDGVNKRALSTRAEVCDGRRDSIKITLPPMGITVFRYNGKVTKK